ncbi:MAG: DUF4230 domain-containing protein [Roseiflexaceae bacterium]|jgi:hypothetical protein
MQRILNVIYMVVVVVALYLWVQQTPAGVNLPKITIEMPGAESVVSATPNTIEPTVTAEPTVTQTQTLTPSATATVVPTATPAKFATSVDTIVRKISSTRKLTTVETILDVVVTFDDTEKKLGWWDGGELLVQRTTVNARLEIDMSKVSILQTNDHWVVSVPASTMYLSQTPERPYYFSKGIRYAFQDGQKDTWRDMVPAKVDAQARERICALGLHKQAENEARDYIIQMALVWNPNMTERDITVNLARSRECPAQ